MREARGIERRLRGESSRVEELTQEEERMLAKFLRELAMKVRGVYAGVGMPLPEQVPRPLRIHKPFWNRCYWRIASQGAYEGVREERAVVVTDSELTSDDWRAFSSTRSSPQSCSFCFYDRHHPLTGCTQNDKEEQGNPHEKQSKESQEGQPD